MADRALLLRAAPLLFVCLWSTGFVAAKYSMHNAEPFVFLCLRFTITALALVPILWLAGARLPRNPWRFRHDMVTGLLMQAGYLGFVFWPIREGLPAGIVAIVIGLQPIFTLMLSALFIGESLGWRKVGGLAIGFAGVAVVIVGKYGLDLGVGGGFDGFAFALCVVGLLSIASGVFYQKKFCDRSHLLSGTLMQYVAGALGTAACALLFGEAWHIAWTPGFALALGWQVFGLSIGAVLLLLFIIRHGEAGRISSMFYLVPPLVVVEAHFLFGESLGPLSIGGMLLCVFGVMMVSRAPRGAPIVQPGKA